MQEKNKEFTLCQHGYSERNNFYFGKWMTAQDFTDEQRYMNEKRWMVNRLGLGWGVLCGLRVRPHPDDRRKVVVEPGCAIDPYGHEVLVCHEETVDLLTAARDGREGHEGYEGQEVQEGHGAREAYEGREGYDRLPPEKLPQQRSYMFYLSIRYEECGVNPSQIVIDSCEGYKEECVYNRTREGYRFIVSREKPDLSTALRTAAGGGQGCEAQCHRFLQDPSPVVSAACPDRPRCEAVPLAAICYNPTTETTTLDIDLGMTYRKLAFSNEVLYELLSCLRQEAVQGWAAESNRRQHVPLLASTIRGVQYRDGRTARLDRSNGYGGSYPFRLTSDGDYVWVTDREDRQVWRIERATNRPVSDKRLHLDDPSWGIAFDGRYMWISHHGAFRTGPWPGSPPEQAYAQEQPPPPEQAYANQEAHLTLRPYPPQIPAHGRLTRVDVCTLERRTIDALPRCESLPACYSFPEAGGAPGGGWLHPYAGEVVLHDGDIYVAHDVPRRGREEERPDYERADQPAERREQTAERREQPGERVEPYPLPRGGYDLYLTRIDPNKGCVVEVIPVPATDDREPLSRIEAMASDGGALWITYRASSRDRRGERAVVRKVTKENGRSVVSAPYRLRGEAPEHMVFDGTRMWVSHNDGLSILDIEAGDEETVNTDTAHTALAYSGGSLLWAAVPGKNEAFITRIDIFSEEEVQRTEFIEVEGNTSFEISDMQYDGTYIYVAYRLTEGQNNRGVIQRLLP